MPIFKLQVIIASTLLAASGFVLSIAEAEQADWRDHLVDVGHGFQMYDVSNVDSKGRVTRRTRSFTTKRDGKKLTVGTLAVFENGQATKTRDWIYYDHVMLYDRYRTTESDEAKFRPLDNVWLVSSSEDNRANKIFRIYTRTHKDVVLFEISEAESGLTPAQLSDSLDVDPNQKGK